MSFDAADTRFELADQNAAPKNGRVIFNDHLPQAADFRLQILDAAADAVNLSVDRAQFAPRLILGCEHIAQHTKHLAGIGAIAATAHGRQVE